MTNSTDEPATTRGDGAKSHRRPIVVGLDGSKRSKEALRWAADYARLTGTKLHAIAAWYVPGTYGWAALPSDWTPEIDAKKMVEAELAEVLGSDPGVEVSTAVEQGHPAQVLAEASKHASLIVVGSRGRGEFAGMLLGSVSRFLTSHAHCPVVIIRDDVEVAPK